MIERSRGHRTRARTTGWRGRLKSAGLIQEQRLSYVLDFGDGALEVEGLGKDNLEDLQRVSFDCLAGCLVVSPSAH